MKQIKLHIQGVSTLEQAKQMEETLRKDAGIQNVKVSGGTGKALVVFDEDITSAAEILGMISQAGFSAQEIAQGQLAPAEFTMAAAPHTASVYQKYTAKQLFFGGLLIPAALGLLAGGVVLAKNVSFGSFSEEKQHIRGNVEAAVKLVEYADFQCPFCERHYPILNQILQEYGDKVSIEYKHFPLSFHPFAQKAAEASECAAEQKKFWEFHDKAFENQNSLSLDALKQWAKELNLNMKQFAKCLDSGKYAAKVRAEEQEGEALNVDGTPTTFVNGSPVIGAVPYETLKQEIDKALQK